MPIPAKHSANLTIELHAVYRDQIPTSEGNTIVYDQTVLFRTFDSTIDASQVVSQPFDDAASNFLFRERLRVSHEDFAEIPNEHVAPRIITSTESQEDLAIGVGLIAGIGIAGATVIIFTILFIFRSSLITKTDKDAESHEEFPEEVEPSTFSVLETDDEDPRKPLATSLADSLEYGDQSSVCTADYDYSIAYDGLGEDSVGSSVSTQKGPSPVRSAADLGRRRSALGSSELYDEDNEDRPIIKVEIFEVDAPPGKLGLVIDTPDQGPPLVHSVNDLSVLAGQVHVGDKLLKVDGQDVASLTAARVSRMISQKSNNPSRKLLLKRVVTTVDGKIWQ